MQVIGHKATCLHLKPCKLRGIVLTFQGFWADVSSPSSASRRARGEIIKIHIGVFDVAWLENKGAYSSLSHGALQALRGGEGMGVVSIKELLEAGVHFGHQTNRWNPKMKKYLFGERNGIYIIDLQQTVARMEQAYAFVRDTVASGQSVLFVGTKRQAAEILQEEAVRSNMFYVNQRWLGGMLTNFQTIRRSIDKMKKLEGMLADPAQYGLTKKEIAQNRRRSSSCRSFSPASRTCEAFRAPSSCSTRGSNGLRSRRRPVGDSGHRHHRQQLRSRQHHIPDSRQRRRDSLDQAHHVAHRGRLHRRRPFAHATRRGRIPLESRRRRQSRDGIAGWRPCVITIVSSDRTHPSIPRRRTIAHGWSKSVGQRIERENGRRHPDCQKALQESGDDIEKAIDYLRQKGLAAAQKKSGRETNQGLIHAYIHMGGKIGVLIEVNCETDFVARNEEFKAFVNDLALQVAAAKPHT